MSTRGGASPARLHLVVDVVFAPAKLTVSLRITGVRDDGYHLIDAEMVSLDLADRLMISEGDGLEVVGPAAAGIASGDSNLVRRALSAAGRRAHVRVEKHIRGCGVGRRIERCRGDPAVGRRRRPLGRCLRRGRCAVLLGRRTGARDGHR